MADLRSGASPAYAAPIGDVKVSMGEKVAYGLGNTSAYIIYTLMTSMLAFFYTDYIGISAGAIGTIMLVSRIFDGVSDVIMGHITDHTHSRHGKARAWLLWMTIPYGVTGILMFLIPAHASAMFQYIWIFVTYNLVNTVVYTATNLPYGALAAMMTRNQYERESINVLRMGLGPFGGLLISAVTLPMVRAFGDDQRAWIIAMSINLIIGMALELICFFGTKERVEIPAAKKSDVPFAKSLRALFSNKYWALGMGLWGILSIYGTFNGTSLPYFCKYILGDAVLSSSINLVETLVQIAVIFMMPYFLKRFGKRNTALAGAVITILGQFPVMLAPSHAMAMVSAVIRGIGVAPLFAVVFSFIADAVEYGQWKTHLRTEGMIMSAASVGSKLGGGLASAVLGKILDFAGFNGLAAAQAESALTAIRGLYLWAPIIIWAVAAVMLICHQLDKKYPAIMKELAEREAHGEL